MNPLSKSQAHGATSQSGLILFIALIALVAMSLAAVALVRSVDTSTIIAGNLAFKQSATSSADSGFETAIDWLTTTSSGTTKDITKDADHPLNVTNAAQGYYSNVDSSLDLAAESTWDSGSSMDAGTDATGNSIRYVIQRMCRNANSVVTPANCLLGSGEGNNGEQLAGELSLSASSASTMYRITARVTGPRNTVSYIQAFAY